MNLSPEKKIAGVLAPLFALRTEDDLGVGDIAALRQFIDWSAQVGFKLVQLLPINETGGDHSPYNAISSRALEPTTLHLAPGSPVDLSAEDFAETIAHVDLTRLRKSRVKYKRVKRLKRALLERAFTRFCEHQGEQPQHAREFAEFCAKEKSWLDDYAFFRAIMEKNHDRETWDAWREEHRSMQSARAWLDRQSSGKRAKFAAREKFFRYIQWIAYTQWAAIKAYAEERGVALMGDIPFGISYYSADVFARPDEFSLEWSGGAPPEPYFKDDAFTQKWGQNWGIPLYRWDLMRRRNFDWWRDRVRGVKQIFHIFRIDHVLGFYRIYAFPWRPHRNAEFFSLNDEEMRTQTGGAAPHFAPRHDLTPENCEANKREGEEYLQVVVAECAATQIVGEDLGTVPDYVRPSLRSLGIAGFKIPQWEAPEGRVTPGNEYERLSVATYATHDHKPVRALWQEAFERASATSEQSRRDLEMIAQFSGIQPTDRPLHFQKDFYPAIMEALFRSEAWIAIVMITDLLARTDRFNVPGTAATSNWTRRMRMSVARLDSSRVVRHRMRLIRELLEKTGRI